jgi:hypothetical protein
VGIADAVAAAGRGAAGDPAHPVHEGGSGRPNPPARQRGPGRGPAGSLRARGDEERGGEERGATGAQGTPPNSSSESGAARGGRVKVAEPGPGVRDPVVDGGAARRRPRGWVRRIG